MRPENFKDQDRVRHIGRNEDGIVRITDEGHVEVTFDKPNSKGNPSIGVYDYNWFRTYPEGLKLLS